MHCWMVTERIARVYETQKDVPQHWEIEYSKEEVEVNIKFYDKNLKFFAAFAGLLCVAAHH